MDIYLKDSKSILVSCRVSVSLLRESFAVLFPFLELELMINKRSVSNSDKKLAELSKNKIIVDFEITPEMSVEELENEFEKQFGIEVIIFRRVGASLVRTSFTKNWSLQHQNNKGGEILNDFGLVK